MRLICPNCGAQYEVAADVIPTLGRDVQCSNCGHTWFEAPGASEAAEADYDAEDTQEDAAPPVWDEDDASNEELAPAPQPPTNRPALDPSVAEILREEAEREAAARRSNVSHPIENQEDLGLEEAPKPTSQEQRNIEAARRMSQMAEEEAEELSADNSAAAIAAAAAANRKEMLPDIEEINSSLRSSADRGEEIDPTPDEIEETKKRGFRFGFVSVLIVIALLWAAYMFAEDLKTLVPSMANTLDGYVETVDRARLWLDGQVQGLMDTMEGTASDATDAPASE